jgi:hypothetical protein
VSQSAQSADEVFQLHTASDGRVYRIDTRSGKTSLLEGASFREVSEPGMSQLVVGKIYRSEDGKSTFRYSGDGKLEPWSLDKYFQPDGKKQK